MIPNMPPERQRQQRDAHKAMELKGMALAFALLAVLFIAVPELDLTASSLFFDNGAWRFERESGWLAPAYWGVPRLGQATLVVLAVLWILGFIHGYDALRARRFRIGFLLAAALLGPILLVDMGLKGHSGRARPVNVQEFGGRGQFTPAFIPANECRKNCAFVSGHVATASFLMASGWLGSTALRRRWLIIGAVAGGFMTLVRMAPGGHFLSDGIFAWFGVYFVLWLTEWTFRLLNWLPAQARGNNSSGQSQGNS